jgi:hypothetical protein
VTEGDGFQRRILDQLQPIGIAQLVTNRGQREVLPWRKIFATLQADDGETRLGEFARQDAAGPAHADHDRVDFFQSRCHD